MEQTWRESNSGWNLS